MMVLVRETAGRDNPALRAALQDALVEFEELTGAILVTTRSLDRLHIIERHMGEVTCAIEMVLGIPAPVQVVLDITKVAS